MFDFLKKREKSAPRGELGNIYATQTGTVVSLSEVPDDIIKEKVLGDGVAIIPKEGKVYAPVDGKITQIADSLHAFGLQTADGLEILVHVGIDTVTLKGKGFKVHVKQGDQIYMGDLLCDVDLSVLEENNLLPHTAILITNMEVIKELQMTAGETQAGVSTIMNYK